MASPRSSRTSEFESCAEVSSAHWQPRLRELPSSQPVAARGIPLRLGPTYRRALRPEAARRDVRPTQAVVLLPHQHAAVRRGWNLQSAQRAGDSLKAIYECVCTKPVMGIEKGLSSGCIQLTDRRMR